MSAAKAATVGTGNGRQAILDSALRNMNERGYHGTSMRDIARDADITVASIYHHFKSEQEILQDIMTRALHDAIAMTRGRCCGRVVRRTRSCRRWCARGSCSTPPGNSMHWSVRRSCAA